MHNGEVMATMDEKHGLRVDSALVDFIENAVLAATPVSANHFWAGLAGLVQDFGPIGRSLLLRRATLQQQIDAWHLARRGQPHEAVAYGAMLEQIGYLVRQGPDFVIETKGVDVEISQMAGPQLVVPSTNARYVLNAANARWGSLYDALYGTDALGDLPQTTSHDTARAARVVAWVRRFLDDVVPLCTGSWSDIGAITIENGAIQLKAKGLATTLKDKGSFAGFVGKPDAPSRVFLKNNGLYIDLELNALSPLGALDPAHISNVWLEAATSVIVDCEDSVATVDAADKILAYANWLGLMKGDLTETIVKNGTMSTRRLAQDREIIGPDGNAKSVKTRALLMVRNVGHLMTTPAILEGDGSEVGEGLMDALITVACALHDLQKTDGMRNSQTGAVYVVKPKMHGPEEVAFADAVFSRVEAILGLPQYTVKLGIMDEERRTSANLMECIRAAKYRLAFINTGFLDRTGDEIHTSMEAGPMVRKGDMKRSVWIAAYENRNVDIGLACGLRGRAQIGKGMWAAPDRMAEMLEIKIGHPQEGASCAWVPSPIAAILHATHYHRIDVFARQNEIAAGGARSTLCELLRPPLAGRADWSDAEITAEVENNVQGILGYVVRWIDQGIGCSKVPDIHNIALMEDRATCRISSQALANWLHHGVITRPQVEAALQKMANVVDAQNAGDLTYKPMATGFDGAAFSAASDLIFKGRMQPSGYTEPLLHAWRQKVKEG